MIHPIKIDLHTHSTASPDGGISAHDYETLIKSGTLDYIAITDHDQVDLALQLHAKLGDRIIVGQEITTKQGELIGLFLQEKIQPGLDAQAAAQAIKQQGGLVYVPHPFETVRSGIDKITLDAIVDLVDIVEVHNGRAVFQNKGPQATTWARFNGKAAAASSDAHGLKGVRTTYTTISEVPTKANLVNLLGTAHLLTARPPLTSLLYPKLNRLRGKLKKTKNNQ